jgi:hypothetical protein
MAAGGVARVGAFNNAVDAPGGVVGNEALAKMPSAISVQRSATVVT